MGLLRRSDWPERLAAVLEAAYGKPYVIGDSDCLRLACAAVEAQTGRDYWPRFAGYRTKRQALVTIARIAPTFADAVTAVLGVTPSAMPSARRGDIVMHRDASGEDHLGVCTGRRVMLMAATGATLMARDDPSLTACWRIG